MSDKIPTSRLDTSVAEGLLSGAEPDALSRKVFEENKDSVVQIQIGDTIIGTGFAYGKPNQIVTDWHVVQGGNEILVKTSDDKVHRSRLTAVDDVSDLAILELETKPQKELKPLQPGSLSQLKPDDQVIGIGHPWGFRVPYLSPGYVTSKDSTRFQSFSQLRDPKAIEDRKAELSPNELADFDNLFNQKMLSARLKMAPGSSGSPIMTTDGKVVGVLDYGSLAEEVVRATPVDRVEALLNNPPKFQFKHGYRPASWVEQHNSLFRSDPVLMTLGDATAVSGITMAAMRSTRFFPAIAATGAGMLLVDDARNLKNMTSTASDILWNGARVLSDITVMGGGAAGILGKMYKYPTVSTASSIVMLAGIGARAAVDFVPTRLARTDMTRTDGSLTRPISHSRELEFFKNWDRVRGKELATENKPEAKKQ